MVLDICDVQTDSPKHNVFLFRGNTLPFIPWFRLSPSYFFRLSISPRYNANTYKLLSLRDRATLPKECRFSDDLAGRSPRSSRSPRSLRSLRSLTKTSWWGLTLEKQWEISAQFIMSGWGKLTRYTQYSFGDSISPFLFCFFRGIRTGEGGRGVLKIYYALSGLSLQREKGKGRGVIKGLFNMAWQSCVYKGVYLQRYSVKCKWQHIRSPKSPMMFLVISKLNCLLF